MKTPDHVTDINVGNKTPELKPCPFCGGEAEILKVSLSSHGEEKIAVGCTVCDARLEAERAPIMVERVVDKYGNTCIVNSGVWTRPGAIEQWNRRATDENA